MSPEELFATDSAAAALGIELIEGGYETVTMALTVTDAMVNIAGTCHGGVLFTLADSGMQIASNAGAENAFASAANVHYLMPAHPGDRLTVTIRRRMRRGKITHHTGEIVGPNGIVALFDGTTIDVGPST